MGFWLLFRVYVKLWGVVFSLYPNLPSKPPFWGAPRHPRPTEETSRSEARNADLGTNLRGSRATISHVTWLFKMTNERNLILEELLDSMGFSFYVCCLLQERRLSFDTRVSVFNTRALYHLDTARLVQLGYVQSCSQLDVKMPWQTLWHTSGTGIGILTNMFIGFGKLILVAHT